MQAKPECVSCIFHQALRVCQTLSIDEKDTKTVLDAVGTRVKDFNLNDTPPAIAVWVYALISEILNRPDLYKTQKLEATIAATNALPRVQKRYDQFQDKLLFALKSSVIGNVIDLASQQQYDLDTEIESIFETKFAIDHSMEFKRKFYTAQSILIIGDNAGEHIFDSYMLEIFKKLDNEKELYYATRDRPIINDLTYDEALNSPLVDVATVINSGVDTPGAELDRADDAFLEILSKADIVIAKGMGNYESLAYKAGREVFHLLKVKCDVVAKDLRKDRGDIIFAKL
ncbi:MAG: damage-control phosphatase ARMT1 family protein [Campylobacterota bacterium]